MAISDTITSMYENVGEVYDTITNVDPPTNKNIENIPSTIRKSYLNIMNNGYQDIWDSWEKVNGSGTSLSLNNTEEAPMSLTYKGNTSQEGTPTPSTPQQVHTVSGDNSIEICGKNLYSGTDPLTERYTYIIPSKIGETYTLSFKGSTTATGGSARVFLQNSENIERTNIIESEVVSLTSTTATYNITLSSTINGYLFLSLASSISSFTINNIMLELGDQPTTYEPYKGKSYPISLGNMEMCGIPDTDYKDAFVHDDNKWYKYAMIGKVVLKGGSGESWAGTTSQGFYHEEDTLIRERDYSTLMYSDYYSVGNNQIATNFLQNYAITGYYNASTYPGQNWIYIHNQDIASASDLKTWLQSHNTTVYYVLANPTQTEITDETLKAQLDDLWENAISYEGQTNISQTNTDLPFELDVVALKEMN